MILISILLVGFLFLFLFIILAFLLIGKWKTFEKAGKPGWASLIPIYSTIVLYDIIGLKWYYIFFEFLTIIPYVGEVLFFLYIFIINVKLSKSFGKNILMGVGLTLAPPIFFFVLGYDNSINYIGKVVNGDLDFNELF